ncbi:hypothetical protein [Hymenobacter cavernae]|nr:hypothetical protein [Hymenobacter cavernae]
MAIEDSKANGQLFQNGLVEIMLLGQALFGGALLSGKLQLPLRLRVKQRLLKLRNLLFGLLAPQALLSELLL